MKKKLITIIIGMVFCIGWIGGCTSKETNHDNVATSVTEESKQEGVKKEKELTGTIDEIRDFQFVIKTMRIHHIILPLKKMKSQMD